MTRPSWRVLVAVALGVVVCVTVFVVRRSNGAGGELSGGQSADPVVMGRERYAKFAARPVRDLGEEGLRSLLSHAIDDAPGDHTPKELDEVLVATAEFINVRFLQDSPALYREWRDRKGYVHRAPEIISGSGVAHNWRIWTGRKDEEPSFDVIVDGSFSNSLNDLGGKVRPVRIATDPDSLAVVFFREDRSHPSPLLRGKMGSDLWHGKKSGSLLSLWEPPQSRKALLTKPGWLRCACVGVILEGQTGERCPWLFTWVQDPNDHKWYLSWVNIQNFDGPIPMVVY